MGYNKPDLYSQPEKFGLRPIFEYDLISESYEFSIFVMWADKSGTVYYAIDSGCSCYSPFEDFTSLEDATVYGREEVEELLRDCIGGYSSRITADNIEAILYDVRRAVRSAHTTDTNT